MIDFAVVEVGNVISRKNYFMSTSKSEKYHNEEIGIDIKKDLNFTIAVRVIDEKEVTMHNPDYTYWHAEFTKYNGIQIVSK